MHFLLFDQSSIVNLVVLDMINAFDTVNHHFALLMKLTDRNVSRELLDRPTLLI